MRKVTYKGDAVELVVPGIGRFRPGVEQEVSEADAEKLAKLDGFEAEPKQDEPDDKKATGAASGKKRRGSTSPEQ